jgi:hypothetical protein
LIDPEGKVVRCSPERRLAEILEELREADDAQE